LPRGPRIIEIGPGDGSVTQELISLGHSVTAIEIDADLIPRLKKRFHRDDFNVIPADVMQVDWKTNPIVSGEFALAGNLPYNIATALLGKIYDALRGEDSPLLKTMVFTFQKEVAERLTSSVGGRGYGGLTLITEYHCKAEYLFSIPADCFFPKPKVDGGVVRLTPHESDHSSSVPYPIFKKIVRGCFAQRRKVLRNSLRVVNGLSSGWENLPLDWSRRPEDLSFSEYMQLAADLVKLGLEC